MFMRRLVQLFFIFSSVSFGFTPTSSINGSKIYTGKRNHQHAECKELDQKKLFNMIRRGVVVIDVTAHVILNKLVNEKMWHGTGFIVDLERGLIITNAHVAGEMSVCTYRVKFGNGKTAAAKLEYVDPCYDFAILSVDGKSMPKYSIALECSESPVILNSVVYSMGNSNLGAFSTYNGFVFDTESILRLQLLAEQSFQFSGLTTNGASGSPVFNASGEVIGVLYGGKLVSGAALPISYITPVIKAIREGRKFTRYFLGLVLDYTTWQDSLEAGAIPEEVVRELENDSADTLSNKALYVRKVLSAYGAERSSARSGDIVWSVNGVFIGANLKKIDEILHQNAGKNVLLTVYRDGIKKEYEVPAYELLTNMKLLSFAGVTFFEETDEIRIQLGKRSNGVYFVDSEMGSPFYPITSPTNGRNGSGAYQLISIEGDAISSLDDLRRIIPSILKKDILTVRFKLLGADPQESSVIVRYAPKFAEATMYTFDESEKRWFSEQISK
jgi:S1-C subfamily serine protease